MLDKLREKIKDKIVEVSIGLLLLPLSLIWLAIPSETKERATDTPQKKLLLAALMILLESVLILSAWVYNLRKRLKAKKESSKDEKIAMLESENSALKERTARLESEVNSLTHRDTLPEIAEEILLFIVDHEEGLSVSELDRLLERLHGNRGARHVNKTIIEYYLEELFDNIYIVPVPGSNPLRYMLRQKGRKYYIDNKDRLAPGGPFIIKK